MLPWKLFRVSTLMLLFVTTSGRVELKLRKPPLMLMALPLVSWKLPAWPLKLIPVKPPFTVMELLFNITPPLPEELNVKLPAEMTCAELTFGNTAGPFNSPAVIDAFVIVSVPVWPVSSNVVKLLAVMAERLFMVKLLPASTSKPPLDCNTACGVAATPPSPMVRLPATFKFRLPKLPVTPKIVACPGVRGAGFAMVTAPTALMDSPVLAVMFAEAASCPVLEPICNAVGPEAPITFDVLMNSDDGLLSVPPTTAVPGALSGVLKPNERLTNGVAFMLVPKLRASVVYVV